MRLDLVRQVAREVAGRVAQADLRAPVALAVLADVVGLEAQVVSAAEVLAGSAGQRSLAIEDGRIRFAGWRRSH